MAAADVALILLRLVVGGTMIAHGVNHWIGGGKIAGTGRWFASLGLRRGLLQAWLSVIVEIGAGALLVLGLLTPFAAAAIVSVMLVAGLLAHRGNGFFVFKDGYEYVLVLAAAAVALGLLGPGWLSLDHAAGIEVTGWAGGGIAMFLGAAATAGLLAVFYRPASDPPAPTRTDSATTDVPIADSATEEVR
ncbi:DoxX family protein [Nocardia mexicana]|uniref:Putative oxidoreductase n=1 Tax=Nocardia mexicana TaxID=279262 RepID=A0A370HFW2_9NOCA|nr:DoxX family protein [Nocardia mexicana]RDI56073.1 putative oxidoreductase [Nocardia mexicana]